MESFAPSIANGELAVLSLLRFLHEQAGAIWGFLTCDHGRDCHSNMRYVCCELLPLLSISRLSSPCLKDVFEAPRCSLFNSINSFPVHSTSIEASYPLTYVQLSLPSLLF